MDCGKCPDQYWQQWCCSKRSKSRSLGETVSLVPCSFCQVATTAYWGHLSQRQHGQRGSQNLGGFLGFLMSGTTLCSGTHLTPGLVEGKHHNSCTNEIAHPSPTLQKFFLMFSFSSMLITITVHTCEEKGLKDFDIHIFVVLCACWVLVSRLSIFSWFSANLSFDVLDLSEISISDGVTLCLQGGYLKSCSRDSLLTAQKS